MVLSGCADSWLTLIYHPHQESRPTQPWQECWITHRYCATGLFDMVRMQRLKICSSACKQQTSHGLGYMWGKRPIQSTAGHAKLAAATWGAQSSAHARRASVLQLRHM